MEITEKELYKLKQLDRIEFRQRYEKIEREKPESGISDFLKDMTYLAFFIILIAVNFYFNGMPEQAKTLYGVVFIILKFMIIGSIIIGLFWLILFSKHKNQIKKLKEEYFEIVSKK